MKEEDMWMERGNYRDIMRPKWWGNWERGEVQGDNIGRKKNIQGAEKRGRAGRWINKSYKKRILGVRKTANKGEKEESNYFFKDKGWEKKQVQRMRKEVKKALSLLKQFCGLYCHDEWSQKYRIGLLSGDMSLG